MSKTIEGQMLSLKESFDAVGTKFNGLTWQRIEKSHLDFAQSQTQELQEQNAELVEMLEDMETAWQSLPWISNIIHPQILRMREWVSKHKTNTLKSNTNGSI